MKRLAVYACLAALVVATWSPSAMGDDPARGAPLAEELTLGSELQFSRLEARHLPEPNAQPISQPVAEAMPTSAAAPSPPRVLESLPVPVPLPPIEAESDAVLTLGEAEAMATSFHPALREAGARMRAAQGNWVQVGLRPNPAIAYSGEEIGDDGTAGKQGGFISKEFVTAGKLGLNRAVASREVAAAEQQVQRARLQVITSVRIHYFELLAAERGVMLARQLNEIAVASVKASEQRLKALDIPRVALLQSQIESESTALLEQQATERYAAAWRRLAVAIGMHGEQPPALDDSLNQPLPDLNWDTTRDRLITTSPELSQLQFEVQRARFAVQRAVAGRVPNVQAQAGVQHDNATGDGIANMQVSVPLPVFDRNQGGIAMASGELAAAQAALDDKQLELERRLATALRDYATSRERAARYEQRILPVARETLNITNAGYREGELDYLSVLTIQQTYTEKNLAYLQDLETAWKKWAEIDGLLVGPLPEQSE